MSRIRSAARALAVALALLPAGLTAQGNASAAAAAMGGAYTAVARNFNAPAWNPANLGQAGNARLSLAISPQLGLGTGPVTGADLADYAGVLVPSTVRESWLQRIEANGGQDVGGAIDVTPLAFSLGRLAVSATTTLRADGVVPPAFAELLLFGNAGRTGAPRDYALGGLNLDANLTSTIAVAYGRRLALIPLPDFSVGVTGKYVVGHALASMLDNGSALTSDPLAVAVDVPVVLTDTASATNGSGMGLDVGVAFRLGTMRVGATVKDLVSTFAWTTDRLYYVPVQARFDASGSSSAPEGIQPLANAPADLQDRLRRRVAQATVAPTVAVGIALPMSKAVTVAADLRQRLGDGLEVGARTQLGLGAELRLLPFLPLRAGVSTLGDGMRYSGGLGLELGVVNLQLAGAVLQAEGRSDTAVGVTFSLFGR